MGTNAENTTPAMTNPIPTDTILLKVVSLAIENASLAYSLTRRIYVCFQSMSTQVRSSK
jgi:hypothetical protein